MKDVIALLDCHNSPELGELTSSRPLASTSFLGRFAFMDFMMSNFANSGIETVGILCKNHQRSLLKHMGNMSSWVNNTKLGRATIFYNEKGVLNESYNTDLNNILNNDWVLYDSDASTILIAAPQYVMSVDFAPLIEEHQARHEAVTALYKEIDNADKSFLGAYAFEIGEDGYVRDFALNDGTKKKRKMSLEAWIIDRKVLAEMIARYPRFDASFGIKEMLQSFIRQKLYKMRAVPFTGFVRRFDSLEHYVEYSFELLDSSVSKELFLPEWPIFTLTHDTPPALYGPDSKVSNSFISNGCLVYGSVTDSIICRNVKIGKGSSINRCIIFSNVSVGDKVRLGDLVVDKYAIVTSRHTIEGDPKNVIYVKQGAIL